MKKGIMEIPFWKGLLHVLFTLAVYCAVMICPRVFAAENLTGAWTMYHKTTFHSVLMTGYDSTSSGVSFPSSSYTQIAAANLTDGAYSVVTQLQLAPSYTFVRGNDYTMNYHFDFGSYIYPYWPNSSSNSWFFQTCPGSNCNLSYVWQGDSSHQQTSTLDLTITFRATSDSNSVTFTIGNTTDDKGTFYNAYTSQQGIRISSANITEVSNQIDLSPIIDNQNQNTQDIIDNQNQNTQDLIDFIESNSQVCNSITYDYKNIVEDGFLNVSNGSIASSSSYGVGNYVPVNSNSNVIVISELTSNASACFYDNAKTFISCTRLRDLHVNDVLTIPNNAGFFRSSFDPTGHTPSFTIYSCQNGNQAITDSINDLNNNINNDDSSGAIANADGNFSDVDLPNMGLQSLLNTIVSFIGNLFTQTCDPLVLPLPFVNQSVTLPCMSTIYSTHFNTFYVLWQTLLTGFIAYKVIINLFHKIHQLEDPNYDKVEVLDL